MSLHFYLILKSLRKLALPWKNERKIDGYCHCCQHIQLLRTRTFNVSPKMKNAKLFLAACNNWDEKVNLEEINQTFPHGRLIGYGNSFLDFFFARLLFGYML